jgi:DNA-directed RNA polymerase subunit beta
LGFRAITPVFDGARESEIEAELARAWMIDAAWTEAGEKAWEWINQYEYDPETIKDDDEVRNLYLEAWLGERDYDVYRIVSDPQYARRAVLHDWLKD